MEAAGLMLGGLAVVAPLAQATAAGRVVGVEALVEQLAPAEWMVVSHGGHGQATQHADRVTVEHRATEAAMASAVVATRGGCATLLISCTCTRIAS
jgi:sarcosine oxidase gamma subunit